LAPAAAFVAHFEASFQRGEWLRGCAYTFEGEKVPPIAYEDPAGTRLGIFSIQVRSPDAVVLCLIRSEVQRRGHGRRMLTALCAEADRQGVALTFQAVPDDSDPETQIPEAKLIQLYREFGFIENPAMKHKPYMTRKPLNP